MIEDLFMALAVFLVMGGGLGVSGKVVYQIARAEKKPPPLEEQPIPELGDWTKYEEIVQDELYLAGDPWDDLSHCQQELGRAMHGKPKPPKKNSQNQLSSREKEVTKRLAERKKARATNSHWLNRCPVCEGNVHFMYPPQMSSVQNHQKGTYVAGGEVMECVTCGWNGKSEDTALPFLKQHQCVYDRRLLPGGQVKYLCNCGNHYYSSMSDHSHGGAVDVEETFDVDQLAGGITMKSIKAGTITAEPIHFHTETASR